MPKSSNRTQKGQFFHWLRNNPGEYTIPELIEKFSMTQVWTKTILRELNLNYPHRVYEKNNKWVIGWQPKGPHGGARFHPPGRKYGRPPKPTHLKRIRCGDITLPKWLYDWLKEQPGPAGRVIERLLIKEYGLKEPKI